MKICKIHKVSDPNKCAKFRRKWPLRLFLMIVASSIRVPAKPRDAQKSIMGLHQTTRSDVRQCPTGVTVILLNIRRLFPRKKSKFTSMDYTSHNENVELLLNE
jgi:hypothetical protein